MTDVYAEISQSNYDIANDKLELDEINNLLPADFTLIEERIGDNSAIYYSPKRHEIVLSFKGTTPTKLVDVQEDIIDVGGSIFPFTQTAKDGRYMEEVAKDYNKIQSKEGRNQLKKSLSSNKKNVIQGFNKLVNFIENTDMYDAEHKPKISLVGHSLGANRVLGVKEMIEHVEVKEGKKLYDIFDIESHIYNPAPYPTDQDGNFYFLNENMRLNVYATGITFEDEEFEKLGTGTIRRQVNKDFEDRNINIKFPSVRMELSKKVDGKYYELQDVITGLPAIEKGTFRSHYQPDKNYNLKIIEAEKDIDKASIGYLIDKTLINLYLEMFGGQTKNPYFRSGFTQRRERDDMREYNRLFNLGRIEEAQDYLWEVGQNRGLYDVMSGGLGRQLRRGDPDVYFVSLPYDLPDPLEDLPAWQRIYYRMGFRDTLLNTLREYSGRSAFWFQLSRDILRFINPNSLNRFQEDNPDLSKSDILLFALTPLFKLQEMVDKIDPFEEGLRKSRFGVASRIFAEEHYLSHFTSHDYHDKLKNVKNIPLTKDILSEEDVKLSISKKKKRIIRKIENVSGLPPKQEIQFVRRDPLKEYCLLNPDDIICKDIKR